MSHRVLSSLVLCLLALTVPAAAEIPVTGRVVGPDGKPLTGVVVTLEPILGTYDRARLRLEGKPGPEPVARARPDAAGIFEIAAPEIGMWRVVVTAPRHLKMELRLTPLVAADHLPALKLRRTKDLVLHLADYEGRPQPGRVGVFTTNVRGGFWRPHLRLATAGDDGVARLPRAAEEHLKVVALADGHPMVATDVGAGENRLRLKLPPGAAGTVHFTDSRQKPRSEVLVYRGTGLVPIGVTDEEGRLELVLSTGGPSELRALTDDHWYGSFDVDLNVPEGEAEPTKTLELNPPVILRGSVLDASNRDPIPDALVWAGYGPAAVTDSRGRYQLARSGEPPRNLSAAAAKYQRGYAAVSATGDGPSIPLQPAVGLRGRVVDVEGKALPAVEITVTVLPSTGMVDRVGPWFGETSRRGTFEVYGLSPGIGYRVAVEIPGFAPQEVEVPPLEPFTIRSGLEIVMVAGRLGVGRVVDGSEAPIVGAEIRLEPTPSGDPMLFRVRFPRGNDEPEIHATDGQGRFKIADLAAGRYDLAVRATGFAPLRIPGLQVEEGGGEVDFGTVVLVPGAIIEGQVTDPDGKEIAEAELVATLPTNRLNFGSSTDPVAKAATDDKGRFFLGDLAPEQMLTLSAYKKGYGVTVVNSLRPPTEEPVVIVLQPAGRLVGLVVDRNGSPIEGANISASPQADSMISQMLRGPGQFPRTRSDEDGRFVLEEVDPAPLQLNVRASSYQTKNITGIEVAPGKEREIEIVLDSGAVIDGRVVDASGEPAVRVSVNVANRDQGPFSYGGSTRTDADGRFFLDNAPLGSAFLSVQNGGLELLKKPVELKAGTNIIELVLEDGHVVSGTVFGPEGSPVGGVAISVQEIQQPGNVMLSFGYSQARSSADGTFTLSDVRAGRYRLTAALQGYAQARTEEFEVDGDVAGLVLELQRGATLQGNVLGLEVDELGSLSLMAYGPETGAMRQGQVDFSARYTINGLTPGNWHVQARVGSSGRMQAVPVEVPEGATEVEQDIEFSTGYTLTGTVLEGGEPVAGANIVAAGSMNSMGQGVTDLNGRFIIEHLKAGSYRIMVMSAQSSMRHTEELELAGDRDIEIKLSSGQITGRVVADSDGRPIAGASLSIEQIDVAGVEAVLSRQMHSSVQAISDANGVFQLPRVREGTWRVIATRDGFGPAEATVFAGGGAPVEVELRMAETEGVSFEVVAASGTLPSSLQVLLLAPGGTRLASGSHQVIGGRVRIATVPPGRWELAIQGGDSAVVVVAVDAPGDQGRVVLPPGGNLLLSVPELQEEMMASVFLTGPDGRPFSHPSGTLALPGGWLMSAGRAQVPALMPGVWSIEVRHEDGRSWSGSATVAAGEFAEVTLP